MEWIKYVSLSLTLSWFLYKIEFKVLPGLYLGSLKDSKDPEQLEKNQITHILSIHDDAKEGTDKVIYCLIIQIIYTLFLLEN